MVDYASYLKPTESPINKALSMYRMNSAIQEDKYKQGQREAKKQNTAQMQKDLYDFSKKEDITPADILNIKAKYPTMAAHFDKYNESLSEDQKKNSKKSTLPVLMALEFGNIEDAKKILSVNQKIAEDSGMKDKANALKSMLKMLEIDETGATLKASLNLSMHSNLGDKDYISLYGKIKDEKRKQGLQPQKLELSKEKIKKEKKEILKLSEEIGLKRKQTLKIIEETKKVSNEVTKQALIAKAFKEGKITDPQKIVEVEQKLRKEYAGLNSGFLKMSESIRGIRAIDPNIEDGVQDISLITSFMKMIDEGSTVREAEFAAALKAAGWIGKLTSKINSVQKGSLLDIPTRKRFKKMAEKLFKERQVQHRATKKTFSKIIKDAGLNKDHIFFIAGDDPKKTAEQPKTPATAALVSESDLRTLE